MRYLRNNDCIKIFRCILFCTLAPFLLCTVSLSFAQDNYVFGPSIRVNDDPPTLYSHVINSSGQHGVACKGDTVYVVFRDERTGERAVFFAKSTDAGQTWLPNFRIDGNIPGYISQSASIALDAQGWIYVAYGSSGPDWNICCVKSTDGGQSFSAPVIVDDTTGVGQSRPSIAVDSSGQNVFVVWDDNRNPNGDPSYDIYFARSTDGGASFLPNIRVDDTGSDSSWQLMPSVGCTEFGDTIYVAWDDYRNGQFADYDIYFSRSIDSGQTFEPNILVSDTIGIPLAEQWQPSLWVSKSGNVYVVWQDNRTGGYHIWIDKSTDGGISFNQNIMISDMASSIRPSIAVDDSEYVYVAWDDNRDVGSTGFDIYFAFSSDGGSTFRNDVRVNDLGGSVGAWDWNANIAVNNEGRVFVAWDTDRNEPFGDLDIYIATGQYQAISEGKSNSLSSNNIQISPNPFKNKVRIMSQNTTTNDNIGLQIFDASGRCVKTFCSPYLNQIVWQGTDEEGNLLPAGVYFCRLKVGEDICIKKVTKIK